MFVLNTQVFSSSSPWQWFGMEKMGPGIKCVGMYQGEAEDSNIVVDHLELSAREKSSGKSHWVRPVTDDIQVVQIVQILQCEIDGKWDFNMGRKAVFVVDNVKSIQISK